MFGRMMNSYYYGKSGKGDYRKEDLPDNRWQLFWEMLRTRASALCRLNLMYALFWLPAMIVILMNFLSGISNLSTMAAAQDGTLKIAVEESAGTENALNYTDEDIAAIAAINPTDYLNTMILRTLLFLVPCLAITGPATAGVSYVVRNWARDEHAFIWTDFKDAMKENWKQGLVISVITGALPMLVYVGWRFYGQMAVTQTLMIVPQMLILMIGILWALCVTYFYPLMVTYDLKLKDMLRNGMLLGIARLPMSLGIRLLHCVPVLLGFAVCYFWNPIAGSLILFAYYVLFGFSFSRFITASYTNAVFDKFLNPRIEGAVVNRGLRQDSDDDDDDEDEEPVDVGNQNLTE